MHLAVLKRRKASESQLLDGVYSFPAHSLAACGCLGVNMAMYYSAFRDIIDHMSFTDEDVAELVTISCLLSHTLNFATNVG
jgi:hypothetical protein